MQINPSLTGESGLASEAASNLDRLTPDDDRPPLEPRRDVASGPLPDVLVLPDQDDGPEAFEEALRLSDLDRRAVSVAWAKDENAPDFAHLAAATAANVVPPRVFKLTPDVLDLVIRANSFKPQGPDDMFVFALRGGMLAKGQKFENQDFVEIEDKRPNHRDFCCTIGFYDRKGRKISAFLASTVPHAACVESYHRKMRGGRGINANLLPTGCYVFRVANHKNIQPALRMTEPDKPGADAVTTVLRTHNDLSYAHDDLWDRCQPVDNVHCAYYYDRFSSAGCLTIQGPDRAGPWGQFQKVVGKLERNRRIDVMLVTGRDAAIAAQIIAENRQSDEALVLKCLARLRLGSEGPVVAELQKKLGFAGSSYFGPSTRLELVSRERALGKTPSDGIYSPDDDREFAWGIFTPGATGDIVIAKPAEAPVPPAGGGQVPPAGGPVRLDPSSLILLAGPEGSQLSPDQKSLAVPGEGLWAVGPQPGKITFTPEAGFAGSPRPVRYQVKDTLGQTATASLSVTVQPPNKPPVLAPDFARTSAGVPVVVTVLENDTDLDGQIDPASVRLTRMPQGAVATADGKTVTIEGQGTWQVLPDGSLRFSPVAGFTGEARVTYQASDDKGAVGESVATVSVAPGFAPPTSVDDTATGAAGSPVVVDVLANDTIGRPLGEPPASPPPPETPAPTDTKPEPPPQTEEPLPPPPPPTGGVRIGDEQVRRFAPGAKESYLKALLRNGDQILGEYGVNANARRLCHFLGQIAHESGGFTIECESLNYKTARRLMQVWPTRFPTVEYAQQFVGNEQKLANKVYQGRLGNVEPGDGYRYRGRGLIQITGRGAYREFGNKLGIDLEGNPDLAFDPDVALRIAVRTWNDTRPSGGRSMNQLADDNKIEEITKRINGGYNGLADRRLRFRNAWSIWGSDAAPAAPRDPNLLERGDSGEGVAKLQRLLVRAGFLPANEEIDGRFGGNTQKTVMRFQLANKLNVNGIVDAATWAALEKAPVVNPEPDGGRRGPGREAVARRTRGGGGREVLRLLAVIAAIVAAASFVLLTMWAEHRTFQSPAQLWLPAALLGLAVLLLIGTSVGAPRDRAAGKDPKTGHPAGPDLDVGKLDSDLRNLGFDESYFADPEPVRNMPALPEDVAVQALGRPATAEAPELALSSTLKEADAGQDRKSSGQVAAGIAPFRVAQPSTPFVIISMFGGDNNLSGQVKKDLGEMAAGASRYGNIAVLALADTETGPGTIVEVTPGGEIRTIEQLGEIDTGDPETLAQFMARALVTYPQARKAIGFWDHGSGVFDEGDAAEVLLDRSALRRGRGRRPARRLFIPAAQREALNKDPGTRAMLHDNSGGVLTNLEAGRMLHAAFARAGQPPRADVLYSDTCLNGMIEVVEELSDFAHCFVASCDTEPPAGWDYEEWIRRFAQARPAGPADWARQAVQAYGASYEGQTRHFPCTLAAYHTENDITETFAALVAATESEGLGGFTLLNLARGRCQAYDNRDTYDLGDFADILMRATGRSPKVYAAAVELKNACRRALVDRVAHGPTVTASQGLAFWFPSTTASLKSDIATYRRLKFNRMTNWGEYLSEMYQVDAVA